MMYGNLLLNKCWKLFIPVFLKIINGMKCLYVFRCVVKKLKIRGNICFYYLNFFCYYKTDPMRLC